ncbi:putative Ig domain-containing protein [Nodosilinea sp. LEGE 06152]|nr:putative Ig domain-containing protein [Nodosilinea sp. LEGE 06152]
MAGRSWKNAANGNWSASTNWDTGVPVTTDTASITLNGLYTVDLDVDTTIVGLALGNTTAGSQTLILNGYTLTLNGASTVNSKGILNFNGGTLTGTGSLTANAGSTLIWSGGTQSGSGKTIVTGNLQINDDNYYKNLDGRTLETRGNTTWTGNTLHLYGSNGATWNNTASGSIDLQSDADFYGDSSTTFNNAGTLTKSVGSTDGTDSSVISALFNNSGTVEVQQGVLSLQGGGSSTGNFSIQSGGSLEFSGGTHTLGNSSSIDGAGKVRFSNGSTTEVGGAYNLTGTTEITGGIANFGSSKAISTTNFALSYGDLSGSDTVTTTNMVWSGGTQSGSGKTIVTASLQINDDNYYKNLDGRTLETRGNTTWTGNTLYLYGSNGATWNNAASGSINLQSDADFYGDSSTTFNNAGTLTKSLGVSDGTDSSVISALFNNSGTVKIQQGALTFTSGYTQTAGSTILSGGLLTANAAIALQGGSLLGFGNITGNVSNASQIDPGLGTGILNIDGDYTQAGTGILNFDLGGRTAGTAFDLLSITGTATLDGTLKINLINGFTPTIGDTFQVLKAGTLSGSFTNIQGLNLGNGVILAPTIANNSLILTATQDANYKPGTLSFSAPTFSVNEDGTTVAAVTVFRTGGSDGVVSASIVLSNGTATSPADYDSTPVVVSFAPGETNKTVTIPIVNDTFYESDETISLTLTNPTGGATLGTQKTAVLTIIDDDKSAGILAFSNATFSVNEDGIPITTITITRTGGSDGAVSATVYLNNGTATSPDDYNSTPIVINFVNGETSKTIAVPILDDVIYEGNETLNIYLENATGGATIGAQSSATLTIVENEVPAFGALAFNGATYSVNENGVPITEVIITRTGGSDGTVGVTLTPTNGTATTPADYDSAPITIDFAAGETSKTITIPIADDTLYESNETINLTLSNPTGGATLGTQKTAILTIVDDDAVPGVLSFGSSAFSINEDGTPVAAITINRTDGSDGIVTATITPTDGTATALADYNSAPIVVTFTEGETSKVVTLPVIDDSLSEGSETIDLILGNPTGGATIGAQSAAVLTILDDDVPDLVVSNIVAPVKGIAGQQIEVAWTITNQGTKDATGTWTDSIYLSGDQQLGNDQALGSFSFTGTIAARQSITRQQLVTLPTDLTGDRWVVVQADTGNQITESVEDNNVVVDNRLISLKSPLLPDLKVTEVTAPPTALSGGQATVKWTVTNTGTGATNSPVWYDSVWLSLDNEFDNTDIFVGRVANPSYLNLGEGYTNSLTVSLPQGIANNYRFIVKTDEYNQVEELNNEGDNFGTSAPTDIQPSPLADLQVSSANAPTQAFSGQSLSLTWTVSNEGQGKTLGDSWYDAVYMSTDTTLDNQDKLLGLVLHTSEYEYLYYVPDGLSKNLIRSGVLGSNESYNATQNFALPIGISGDFFFLVQADTSNEVFEGGFESNNVSYDSIATRVTLTPPPDLEVESIDVPTAALASNPFTINYRVTNFGATVTPNFSWQDAFYLSADDQLNLNTDLYLGIRNHSGALEPGESYDGSETFTLPDRLTGNYRIFVVTDSGNDVFELDNANNTVIGENEIAISSRPADLIVQTAGISGNAEAGKAVRVDWTVTNQGTGNTAVENWTDQIYISADGVLDSNDIMLGSFARSGLLNAGAFYTRNELVELPFNLAGDYSLFVVTDSGGSVYEATNEGNNSSSALPVTVNRQTPDLRVTQLNVPVTAQSGGAFTINWTVENQGIARTNVDFWYDQVYLSLDSVISDDDISLDQVYRTGALDPAASYQVSKTFTLPSDLTGQFHVLVRTDSSANVIEGSLETNNDLATNDLTTINLGAVSDLVVQSVDAPATAISNQLFSLTWTVQNNGAATGDRAWRDTFYLSRDQFFDRNSDIFLGYQDQAEGLEGGESYTQTQSFQIPRGLSGSYYVFAVADSGEDIYERTGEQNNIGYNGNSIQVNLPAPAELSISSITVPATGVSGKNTTITYTVTNQGTNAAEGGWWDSVYLSKDSQWDIGDTLIGQVYHLGGVAGGASYTETLEAPLPGAVPGNYNIIVRSDIRNQIPEVNEANNTQASVDRIALDAERLDLDVQATGTLAQGQAVYYRIDVAAGETLQVKLDSQSNAINELYIRYGEMPTRSQFDVGFSELFVADQEVVIPTTRAGTYYVLAYENAGPSAPYTIKAETLDFSLLDIGTSRGSNLGQTTITLSGVKLSTDGVVRLIAADGTERTASRVLWKDDSTLWATFDLRGLAIGEYDVRVDDKGKTATLEDRFTVTAGPVGKVEIGLSTPSALRPDQQGIVTVAYTNTGETDFIAPLLEIVAANADLRMPNQSSYTDSEVQLLAINTNGPAGILAPGATGQFSFMFKPTVDEGSVNFSVSQLSPSSETIDWSTVKESARPSDVSLEAWEAIWSNFTAGVGQTVGDYLTALADNATHLSQLGEYTANVSQLLGFELQQAGNTLTGVALTSAIDLVDEAPGIALAFGRVFQQSLVERYTLSSLGRGWTHQWDTSLTADADSNVTIQTASGQRVFTRQADGTYVGATGDFASLTVDQGVYRLRELDGAISVFRSDGKLDYVQDTNGNRITAGYTSGRLTSLAHSNGDILAIAYNPQGRIGQVTDSTGRTTTYTYDAVGEHLLSVTGVEGTTSYTYDTGHSAAREHTLLSITNPDSTHRYFNYDSQGRLTREFGDGGAESISYSYDTAGGIYVTDAVGNTTKLLLNSSNSANFDSKLGQVRDALGQTTQFNYDANQNPISLTLPGGNSYSYEYDARGNVISQVDPLGRKIEFTYDPTFNRLLSVRDAKGNIGTYNYDSQGNLQGITYADGSSERFSYDSTGNLTRSINRRGKDIDYTYNKDGLLIRKEYADGSFVSYGYDARSNLISATDASGTTPMTYDAVDRLTRIVYPSGRSLDFTYDAGGRRTRMVDQDGFVVNYAYDPNGRLASLTNTTGELITSYTYDAVGRLALETNGNGTYTTYAYDAAGQLLQIINHDNDGTVNSQFDYGYDALGRRTSMTTLEGSWQYEYDATDQLTGITLPGGRTIQYRYDAAGNRISVTDSGVATSYSTNGLNQYTTVGNTTYTYDADGNLISKTEGSNVWTYQYDDENRLIGVTAPNGAWTYQYDALGNRIATIQNGQRTDYLLDPTGLVDVVAEYDSSGNLVAHYTHGIGLTSRIDATNSATYYDSDAIGSTVGLTGANGDYLNRYSYLPFGENFTTIEAVANPFEYVGQWGVMDEGNGLDFMRARFYSPSFGRFLSEDPLGLQGGDVNFYTYVINNPLQQIDPLGLSGGAAVINLPTRQPKPTPTPTLPPTPTPTSTPIPNSSQNLASGGAAVINLPRRQPKPTPTPKPQNLADRASSLLFPEAQAAPAIPVPPGIPSANGSTPIVRPSDPNDIVGPAGFGEEKWISSSALLPYTIRFENRPTATAPAQQVTITHPLDPDLDWRTFRLGNFGWGDLMFEVPANTAFYNQRLDLKDKLGFFIDVVAGIDIAKGEAFWTLTTIDPATGEIPVNPLIGFLPPDNPTTENPDGGLGDGFVNYTVKAKRDVTTGAVIDAKATIVFDTEEPIDTPPIFNTIDAGKPTSSIAALPTTATGEEFLVSWSGNDGTNGSALANFTIYVSDNGAPFTPWLENTKLTEATYIGKPGHTYIFYSVARDNAGNLEATPTTPDAQISVPGTAVDIGTLAFSATEFSVNEDGTPIIAITVTRTNGSSGATSATIALANGTATAPTDYNNASIPVNFANGETTKTVVIPISNDGLYETNETIALTLSTPTGGAAIGTQNTATLTIVSDDSLTVVNSLPDLSTAEDTSFIFTIPDNTFNADSTVNLSYSATLSNGASLPTWLSFDPTTRSFNGTPTNEQVGTLNIQVTATNNTGSSSSETFTLTVTNTNDAPIASNAISDQIVAKGSPFNFTLPIDTFNDVDAGDTLNYAVTLNNGDPLPTWLSFNPTTRTFSGTPPANTGSQLSIIVTATDMEGASVSDAFDLTILNVPPVLDLNGSTAGADFATTFTEDRGAIATVSSSLTLIDTDNTTVTSATITITNLVDGAAESLSVPNTFGYMTAAYDAATGTLHLTGPATLIQYQQVLRTVRYNNTSQNPDPTPRIITLVVNDGTAPSALVTSTVTIVPVNDAPVLDLNGAATGLNASSTFTEDAGFTPIVSSLNLSDVDSPSINGAAVSIRNLSDLGQEFLAANTTGTSITASYDAGTGVLTLQGIDTVANYQQVLRSLAYNNTSQSPTTTSRLIDFVVSDGTANSKMTTATVKVVSVNDRPLVALTGTSATYAENGSSVIVDGGLTLSDADNTTLQKATVRITNFVSNQDNLSFIPVGAITGSFSAGVLTLTGTASLEDYQSVLRSVTYSNSSDSPKTTPRVIQFVINDSKSNSLIVNSTVTITAVNDAPVLNPTGVKNLTTINEDPTINAGTLVSTLLGTAVTDLDAGALRGIAVTNTSGSGIWQYSTDGGSTWFSFPTVSETGALLLAFNNRIRFSPDLNFNGTINLSYRAWDQTIGSLGSQADTSSNGGGTAFSSAIATSNLTINPVNDAPVTSAPGAQSMDEDTVLAFPTATGNSISLSDVDAGTAPVQLTLSATNGKLQLESLDGLANVTGNGTTKITATGTLADLSVALNGLKLTPTVNFNGTAKLTITTNDLGNSGNGGARSDSDVINITVNPVNDAPVNQLPAKLQSIKQGASLVFSSATGNRISISDIDAGSGIEQVILSVTEGALALGSVDGLTLVEGNNTNSLKVQGTLSALNTALNGLRFTPDPLAVIAGAVTLTVTTDDLGSTGGGEAKVDTDILNITVTPTNPVTRTGRNDSLYSSSAANSIRGLAGNDILYGNDGNDILLGGEGDDVIYSAAGDDFIDGGLGNDTLWLGGGQDVVVLAKGNGLDTIYNFPSGSTRFKLGAGLTLNDLTIVQSGSSTLIGITSGEQLASLMWTQSSSITTSNFIYSDLAP